MSVSRVPTVAPGQGEESLFQRVAFSPSGAGRPGAIPPRNRAPHGRRPAPGCGVDPHPTRNGALLSAEVPS
jgi:hypothetical protein